MNQDVTLATLAPLPHWVAWQVEDRKDGKATKVPYSPDGRKAKADAPSTWGDRNAAEQRAALLPKPYGLGGVGIEFCKLGDGSAIGGIDLDACRDQETGTLEPWAEDVLATFDSYAEVSPSGTGAKIFFTYEAESLPALRTVMGGSMWGKQFKRPGGDHPPAIELYLGNRFFAVTDQSLPQCGTALNTISTSTLSRLITTDGPQFAKGKAAGQKATFETITQPSDRSRSGLAYRVGKRAVLDGASFEQMCDVLRQNPDTADWMREKGEANGCREARRIFEKTEASGPLIRVVAGELNKNATAAEQAMRQAKLPIYQRGHTLVRPVKQEVPAAHGRMTVSASFVEMNVHSFIDALCGCATWEKYDGRAEDWVRINPPKPVAEIIMSRVGSWTFPKVVGIITTPTIRPDGSILSAPGYDPATRLYHEADPDLKLTASVQNPTRANAEGALACLKGLLAEFPFVDEVSRSVALSGLITPIVRGALSVAPMHLFKATTAGSGKSYLVDTASAIAAGRPCPVAAAGQDETETEKRLAGLLLSGFPLVSLDNCNGEIGGDLLCQAIERPLIRIRRLGASDIIEIESRATVFATGNAARVRGDMTRRTLIADLDAQMERPELRQFKSDPVATVMADRGRYVSACLVIVRAYILAKCPDILPPIASFSDWSGLVRSALVWLGCADPADSMETAREDDPVLGEIREFIAGWNECPFVSDAQTIRDLIDKSEVRKPTDTGQASSEFAHPVLRDCLHKLAGDRGVVNSKRLSSWLSRHVGRIVDGHRITKDAEKATGGVSRWRLKRVA